MKVKPREAIDLTHQFSPWGGSTENPKSGTSIRCCPAPEACNPLQLNGIDMESAALETPADTRHSPQTSQQTYLLMYSSLSYYDNSYRNLDARLRFSSAK